MTSYPKSPPRTLSKADRRVLAEGSAITPEVIAARGYYTADRRADVPEVFSAWQRRRGLVVPTFSPDGTTRGYQLRPDRPIPRKNGNAPKYETPHGSKITLDVNPRMLQEVRTGEDVLWITEGCKKVDALASRGLPAVGIVGVWNFAVPGTKCAAPLPCWRHVRLSGRTVAVVYDADARTNPDVQEALRRLVVMLEGLGVAVLVVYLPAVNGDGRAGVDDYLAAGGTAAELRLMAHPYKPVDVARERMGRDEAFRAAIEERRRRLRALPVTTTGQNTRVAVVRALTIEAQRSGEIVADGVRVVMDRRTLAEKAAKSRKAVNKAIGHLCETGELRLDNAGRKAERAGAFVLPTSQGLAQKGTHNGRKQGKSEGVGQAAGEAQRGGKDNPGGYPSALGDQVPALRWPKVVLYWAMRDGRRVVAASHYVARLGEKRGEIARHVLETGGRAEVADLMVRFASPKARWWDFDRRVLGPLVEAGILARSEDGSALEIAPDWRESLEREREDADEIEDARRQRQAHARQRQAYRDRDRTPADKQTAPLVGKEENRRIREEQARKDRQRWVEEQRRKVGTTAATFLADEIDGICGVRFKDAAERWRNIHNGFASDLSRAVHYGPFVTRRIDGDLYVEPEDTPPEEAPTPPIPSASDATDDWRGHPLDCDCEDCLCAPTTTYVRLAGLGTAS